MNSGELRAAAIRLWEEADSYFAHTVLAGAAQFALGNCRFRILDAEGRPVPAPPAHLDMHGKAVFSGRVQDGSEKGEGCWSSLEAMEHVLRESGFDDFMDWGLLEKLGYRDKDKHLVPGPVSQAVMTRPERIYPRLKAALANLYSDPRIEPLLRDSDGRQPHPQEPPGFRFDDGPRKWFERAAVAHFVMREAWEKVLLLAQEEEAGKPPMTSKVIAGFTPKRKAPVTPPHPIQGGQWTELELHILEALYGAYHTLESLAKAIKRPVPTVRDALRKGKPLRRCVGNRKGLGYFRKDAPPDLEPPAPKAADVSRT